ncbi:MAG TPA: DUF934 domain-containing protein [Burkholderiaceae bacterium]|nr:DUF934 domain-containing protein [Burkholderiaceae bacterium]
MKFIDPPKDAWRTLGGEDGPAAYIDPRPNLLLTLEQWHAFRAQWPAGMPVGVTLENDAEVKEIAADLPRLALVVLHFPKWVDGRAYSQAHTLRARYRFTGQVRASGDVLVDMVPLLQRTGFDAALLRADQSLDAAHRALSFFPGHYQGGIDDPLPLFAKPSGTAEALAHAQQEFVNAGAAI